MADSAISPGPRAKSIGSFWAIPIVSRPTSLIAWGIFIALAIIGSYGLGDRMLNGHLNTNYGSLVPWGLWVAFYIYCIGISAGAFLISSLVYVFGVKKFAPIGPLSLFVALVTLVIAVMGINIDLGHQFRAWKVLVQPNFQSSITWIVWLYTFYIILLVIELYFVLRRASTSREKERDRKVIKTLGTIGIPLAFAFHGSVGATLGILVARELWHTGIMPLLFITAALASGGALLTFIVAFFAKGRGTEQHRDMVASLGRFVVVLFAIYVVMEFSDILIGTYHLDPEHTKTYTQMFAGAKALSFWFIFVFLGLVVPLFILAVKPHAPNLVGVACFLMAFCFLSMRYHLVVQGFAAPAFPQVPSAYHDGRWTTEYVPSLMEWLSVIALVGLGGIIYMLGFKFLPLETAAEEA